jgi:hypothetical protein
MYFLCVGENLQKRSIDEYQSQPIFILDLSKVEAVHSISLHREFI